MIKNYLKVVWRNFYRRPSFTFLNLSCLTAGLAAVLLILLHIDFETNYDAMHSKADRIYQIRTAELHLGEQVRETENSRSPRNLATYIKSDIPQVEEITRFFHFFQNDEVTLEYGAQAIKTQEIWAADDNLFKVFDFELLEGDPNTALQGPNKIMLTETLAKRLFGNISPLGKTISTELIHAVPNQEDGNYQLVVSGILKDLPNNSHIAIEALLSAETDPYLSEYYFGRFNTFNYALINPATSPAEIEPLLSKIYLDYMDPIREPILTKAVHEMVNLSEIHSRDSGGNTYTYIFSAVAVLLLLIALISYVNLATAQSNQRSVEIGVRKVMGSNRRQLIFQFLAESLLYTGVASILALLIAWTSIDYLNNLLGLELVRNRILRVDFLLGIGGLWLLMGLLGGAYPALFLSSFQPVAIIKAKRTNRAPVRSALVAIQLGVVLFVLCSTGMIYKQLEYVNQKDLGFDNELVIRMELEGSDWFAQYQRFKDQLSQLTVVEEVGTSSFIPGVGQIGRRPISANGTAGTDALFTCFGNFDYDYPEVIGMELLEGRFFSREFTADQTNSVIVNESFVQQFGLEAPIVGQQIKFGGAGNPNSETIVGVIKDFHQQSLHEPVAAQMYLLNSSPNVFIKLARFDESIVNNIRETWQGINPDHAFDFTFMDDLLQRSYELDHIRGRIFLFFSFLTILIAFLGVFGLATFMNKQREKEFSVRKILGAQALQLIGLASKSFVRLVAFVAIPALLLSWYFAEQWLQAFAYRTTVDFGLFALILLLTMLATLLTTGWHAFKVARHNPAEYLKQD